MLFRFIMLFVLLAVSFYVVKLLRAKRKRRLSSRQLDKNKLQKHQTVKCRVCGLYVPEKEAIKQGDKVFCSLKHASQHQE
ncbi:MAG: hypothetical protein KAG28_08130 [Cocleimonas sp.]|nr:hypothetical protein [Cocleimonas sp.]